MQVVAMERRRFVGVSMLALIGMLAALLPVGASTALAATSDPVINEFVADHTGSDTEAFIEIYGDPSTDYSSFTLLEIEGDWSTSSGNEGRIDAAIPIGTTGSMGYWVDDEDMENGTVTILLVEGFSGSVGDDLDTNDDGTLDSTPWTRLVDSVATFEGGSDLVYGVSLNPNYDGISFQVGGASRIPNATDTDSPSDWVRNDFHGFGFAGFAGTPAVGEAENTPGADNVEITVATDPVGACEDTATAIHDVQGSGTSSPEQGNIREIEGVVTGDFQNTNGTGLNGFYVQEEDAEADGNPLSSEGIFVFDDGFGVDVNVGETVRVRGAVAEFFGLTEISNVEAVVVCGSGIMPLATEIELPVSDLSDWEPVEGMLVTLPQALTISEFFNFDRFGEVVLTVGRQFQPTHLFAPGSAAAEALAEANELGRIKLDDGQSGENPLFTRHPDGSAFSLTNSFRGGDTLAGVTGVVDYAFGDYKIQPTAGATYTSLNPRPTAPDPIDGDIRVASFNVLNFFVHLDDIVGSRNGPFDCGPTGSQECRGANTAEERIRQLDKLVAGIIALDADIVGIQEIENDITAGESDECPDYPGDPAHCPVLVLVDALNHAEGDEVWAWVGEANHYNDYPVRNEIIYKIGSVEPVGDPVALADSAFDATRPGEVDPLGRPPLAQTFRSAKGKGSQQKFTVVVNHFKSKGSSCSSIGDPDIGDGQANCNLTRVAQSLALLEFVSELEEESSGVLVIGDLNSYAMEDPISTLEDGGLTELLKLHIGSDAYSYVFDGQLGYLDTALATRSMLNWVKGVTVFHINADEPDILDYDTSFKKDPQDAFYEPLPYRVSDHDPVIVGISFGGKKASAP